MYSQVMPLAFSSGSLLFGVCLTPRPPVTPLKRGNWLGWQQFGPNSPPTVVTTVCMVPGTGIEPVWLAPRDFKSLVSTNFTIRAFDLTGQATTAHDRIRL